MVSDEGTLAYTSSGFAVVMHGARLVLPSLAPLAVARRAVAEDGGFWWATETRRLGRLPADALVAELKRQWRACRDLRAELGLPVVPEYDSDYEADEYDNGHYANQGAPT